MKAGRRMAGLFAALLAGTGAGRASDWPQWRGPNLNGSTDETDLPTSWSKTENLAWLARLPGTSGATPIVLGKRIFLSSTSRTEDLMGMCLSTADGSILWQQVLARGTSGTVRGEAAASSPASDGQRVYFTFSTGDLIAVDLAGKTVWSRNLAKDHGPLAIKFGFNCTPLVRKGRLYLPLLRRRKTYAYSPGAEAAPAGPLKSYVLCLDAATGKTLWKQLRETDAQDESREVYLTPMAVEAAGRTEIIIPGGEFVTAHDSATGKELWRWEFTKKRKIWQRVVPSPVIGDGLIYVCQPQQQGVFALRPGAAGTVPHKAYAWKYAAAAPDVCTPLLYRGRLYVLAGDEKMMSCLDPKTGKAIWSEKIGGKGVWRASPTGADGKIYCVSEGGDFLVLAAGDVFKELFRLPTKARPCRSSVVAAGGSLYLRLSTLLICLRNLPAAAPQ